MRCKNWLRFVLHTLYFIFYLFVYLRNDIKEESTDIIGSMKSSYCSYILLLNEL